MGPLEQEGVPKSRANSIPLETVMGPLEPAMGPQIKCPMEHLAAPDQKTMGPLNEHLDDHDDARERNLFLALLFIRSFSHLRFLNSQFQLRADLFWRYLLTCA